MLAGLMLAANLAVATPAPPPVMAVPDGFTFAAGGDMIGPYHDFPETAGSGLRAGRGAHSRRRFRLCQPGRFDLRHQGFPRLSRGGKWRRLSVAGSVLCPRDQGNGNYAGVQGQQSCHRLGQEGWPPPWHALAAAGVVAGGAGEGLDGPARRSICDRQGPGSAGRHRIDFSAHGRWRGAGLPLRYHLAPPCRHQRLACARGGRGDAGGNCIRSAGIAGPLDFGGGSPRSNEVRLGDQVFPRGSKPEPCGK